MVYLLGVLLQFISFDSNLLSDRKIDNNLKNRISNNSLLEYFF